MANKQRGEVTIEGPEGELKLCLTLGAIAKLEDDLGIESLTEIDTVLEKASSKHLIKITQALLAGGGNTLSDEQMMTWQVDFQQLMEKIQECFKAAGFQDPDDDGKGKKKKDDDSGN